MDLQAPEWPYKGKDLLRKYVYVAAFLAHACPRVFGLISTDFSKLSLDFRSF